MDLKDCSVCEIESSNIKVSPESDVQSTKPKYEVADVLELYLNDYLEEYGAHIDQWKVIYAIVNCRTAELGFHVCQCDNCGHEHVEHNSCRNRHCPKCQGAARLQWVEARLKELLPVWYYHPVFTMPHLLNPLALYNKAVVYDIFLKACGMTLSDFALDPKYLGAKVGFIGLLHTWGQQMCQHVHAHFIFPAGGISVDGKRWVNLPYRKKFLFPSKAMSKRVRKLFSEMLQEAYDQGKLVFPDDLAYLQDRAEWKRYLNKIAWDKWYNYVKKPFSTPEHVVKYIGRYTHRVAISNQRIVDISDGYVTYSYKQYKDGDAERKEVRVTAVEFIRRFLLHVLPKGFKKIRYFGDLSSGIKTKRLELARELLGVCREQLEKIESCYSDLLDKIKKCPECGAGIMQLVKMVDPRIPHLKPG